jgi:RNA polymerase sigma-70 factor, ECF subfamily
MASVETALAVRLHARAGAERWALPVEIFARALERSAAKCPAPTNLTQYLEALHLEDLALAAACEEGLDSAWEHFVREYRPALYRAAQAIDRSGDARELADSLYAELFGVRDRGNARPSLFRYFHGRSTLATWLRSVLAQRHIDRVRAGRRFDPLPAEDEPGTLAAPIVARDPGERPCAELVRAALATAIAGLPPRDRLRLGWYYAQQMTLAEIGRALKEHEATVSRHLSRTRKDLRTGIERALAAAGLTAAAMDDCFAATMDDPGMMDLDEMLPDGDARKKAALDRSTLEDHS